MRIIYLACPYNHPNPEVRLSRFHAANRAAGRILERGDGVYSPISHSHPIAEDCGFGLGFQAWRELDLEMLLRCDSMAVLMLPGWLKSNGIQAELECAEDHSISVEFIEP
jgi:hypothetical protein